MEKGKISFILPVYNGEKTIEKCIKSVINQKIKNYELIIIDDESKDKTGEICQKYVNENRYKNIEYKCLIDYAINLLKY